MTTTVTLDQRDIEEALRQYCRSLGWEASKVVLHANAPLDGWPGYVAAVVTAERIEDGR